MQSQEETQMAVTIFVVRATITKDREAAFNKWYNEEHAPQVLQYNGAVSARRYRKILGEDKFQYMAVYEFASEAVFRKFMESDHLKTLVKEYNANFGETSERERSAYVQIWP
jgi:antibiotic biosynthesis monooxygenase (ABM) superfamily enzyme